MLLRRYHKAKEEEIKEKVETIDEEDSIVDLNKLKVDELKAIAKEKCIEGYEDMKKAELIEKLR